ncbi:MULTISPECIES: PKD domain-containing protein [unclassified Tenacibaculum]|uniref:PKD domain-containing protein n=1 Tax=unclassified Tenacibaculum TaxID=2635139 RepID=UPI001F26E21E|nr:MULTISPECIES: hypothetical protein [unclassified Tenacibaculum]MCF2875893.1 hypothetical protein [Tenacibaculum sp. Cn5-1]MCF2935968.1 hypothetical protein [Tenacibaculum sp. Cn5-34]MCG7512529.1 hypothetical protein [Tenacibaculum sp. Cn5-46]
MKRILSIVALTAAFLTSCSETTIEQQGIDNLTVVGSIPSVKTITVVSTTPPTSSSVILFDFDFEDDNEGFVGVLENKSSDKETPIRNISETTYKCNLARGKKEDFPTKAPINFEGNDTYFMGRLFNNAIKSGGGWSNTDGEASCVALYSTKRTLNFAKDFNVNELSISYDYYGQDVNTSYIFPAINIFLRSKKTKESINLTPSEKGYTWSKYATKIPSKIVAGEYELIVFHAPKGIGLDNIKIYTDKTTSSTSEIKVNAGTDATINLPTNTFDLNSTITNPKGEKIKSIVWTKVSGKGVTIADSDKEDTKVSNLQAGEYVFKIVVTNEKDVAVADTVTIKVDDSKVLYGFTFEENVEDFANAKNAVEKIDKYCRGKRGDFPAYNSLVYSGNDTSFMGINMGEIGGYFATEATKTFKLSKTFEVNKLGVQFSSQVIEPWGDITSIEVELKSASGAEVISLDVNKSTTTSSWEILNGTIAKELVAGDYTITVKHAGGMTAIDDIYIYEK